jgi:DNA-binding MarR family transcriptional regulator
MLLAAFIVGEDKGAVPIKSLSVSSGVPMTTALRHLGLLERAGLVERVVNSHDRRSTLMRLTAEGHRRMDEFLLRLL